MNFGNISKNDFPEPKLSATFISFLKLTQSATAYMQSNLIKFDKIDLSNQIDCDSIDLNQKQNLHKLLVNKLSGILKEDLNAGINMIEKMLKKDEFEAFKTELNSKLYSDSKATHHSMNYSRRIKSLKSCFDSLSAGSVL